MDFKSGMPRLLIVVVAIAGAVVAINSYRTSGGDSDGGVKSTIEVTVPTLTAAGEQGKSLFEKNCMVCHGKNAGGTEQGPPLIHFLYEPGHHGDPTFVLAAKLGVRAHHWQFGNMPAQAHVAEVDVLTIVGFIREVQRANGIN